MMKHVDAALALVRTAFTNYGMLAALLLLCAFFAVVTFDEQHPTGDLAARQLARAIATRHSEGANVLVVVRTSTGDARFAQTLKAELQRRDMVVVDVVRGEPHDARVAIERAIEEGRRIDAIALNNATANWSFFRNLPTHFPRLSRTSCMQPQSYRWPTFLMPNNLLNVANQIAVIAILAIGMTLVIITAGIDLSVGSLVALSAVLTARLIRDFGGGADAGGVAMTLGALGGITVCGIAGACNGLMVTFFRVPAFIITLATMLVASGMAYILAAGQSINAVPDSFVWLGRDADLFGVPNAVVLMLLLYIASHLLMTRTTLGRYIYAVGGNEEAARLSGVPVKRVLMFVYILCGMLAGLGGVIIASQLRSGAPTYGQMYELYVIAAVVVGGTSLMGGEGRVLGTLIGVFIIAVMMNGMNLIRVESYTQKVALGMVIAGAVLLDRLKVFGWRWRATRRSKRKSPEHEMVK